MRFLLAQTYNLKAKLDVKPIIQASDEFELLKALYTSPDSCFEHERHRIELALIIQLAGFTGNRPKALLELRYGDIKVTLLRDPDGGRRPRRLIEITFNHTKGFRGEKEK